MTHIHSSTSPLPSSNPDIALFALIDQVTATWNESLRLSRLEFTPAYDKGRHNAATDEACSLERQLITVEVKTGKGLAAKIRAIAAADFDKADMPEIFKRLARDAERIGAG
jgi:hypothetical protein